MLMDFISFIIFIITMNFLKSEFDITKKIMLYKNNDCQSASVLCTPTLNSLVAK